MNKQKGVSSVIGCEEEHNDDNFGFPRAYPYFFDYGDMSKKLCNLYIFKITFSIANLAALDCYATIYG